MTRLSRSPIGVVFQIAAGLITFLALADGGLAAAPVTVAFGASTGTATSLGAAVYGVAVGGTPAAPTLTATILNSSPEPPITDYTFTPKVSALAFLNNSTSDLVASNSTIGDLYSLPGPGYSTSTDLYLSVGQEDYGAYATGLGVDGGGNILGAGSNNVGTAGPSVFIYEQGDGINPVVMDSINSDTSLAGYSTITTIADVAVSPGTFGNGIHAGDLIVLVADPYVGNTGQSVVFLYPHTVIAQGLSSGFPVTGATALMTQSQFPISGGAVPVSIAISPIDGSLLVAVSDGTIWMIPAVPQTESTPTGYGSPRIYANTGPFCSEGCSVAWGKIAATQQSSSLYVFATVAQNAVTAASGQETGYFEVFSGPVPTGGFTGPTAPVVNIEAVQPTSVAVLQQPYKMGTVLASSCYAPMTCDIIGDGTMIMTITGNTSHIPTGALITAQECVVAADPRGPNCGGGTGIPLPLSSVCPGISDGTVIPGYLCGSAAGTGFDVIGVSAETVAEYSDGIEVRTAQTTTPELGSDPGCPPDRAVYGSIANSMFETQFPTGNMVFDATNGCVPATSSAGDPTTKTGPHPSVHIIGLGLNLAQFQTAGKSGPVGFVDFKFGNLQQTITDSNIKYQWERIVLWLGTAVAEHLVNIGHYDCAAELVYLLDQFVRRHAGDFLGTLPGAPVRVPNSFGDLTMWFGTIFFSIETDVEHKTPSMGWPLPADPHLCHTNECNVSGINK